MQIMSDAKLISWEKLTSEKCIITSNTHYNFSKLSVQIDIFQTKLLGFPFHPSSSHSLLGDTREAASYTGVYLS